MWPNLRSTDAHLDGIPADTLRSSPRRADETGLTGSYDISLRWLPDDKVPDDTGADAPSIYTALQERLGLRLASASNSWTCR
ncbi:MAG: DUF3738 domain-containing protein [Acidobacteriota bacterium]|nr:DUF3738 domain-containing protein [Acidobacteriota bacterium]